VVQSTGLVPGSRIVAPGTGKLISFLPAEKWHLAQVNSHLCWPLKKWHLAQVNSHLSCLLKVAPGAGKLTSFLPAEKWHLAQVNSHLSCLLKSGTWCR
jgi:hypothetical protein